ncbi:MAG: histidinol-phosphatase HisJ family protein [Chloroflexi bacterium]|nr:histidinol-phosphatase HisJ family protein [Chloroflexota bacterium]
MRNAESLDSYSAFILPRSAMIPHDYHTHTNFSCDGKATMAEMCRSAIERGVPEIGFTEHYDLHPGDEYRDWFRLEPWAAEIEKCRAVFGGQLTVRAGIEIGEPHTFHAEAQAMLARYPFDYVLGSLHWVGSATIFDKSFFHRPAKEAFQLYFEELERMTRVDGFDVLSHFDVPVRTAFDVYGRYDPKDHEDCIRPVLRNCIERGIALDINTRALDIAANVLTPGLDILRWYVEMGGERITLGSDAHRPQRIGNGIPRAIEVAKEAGLKYVMQFERRQAKTLPL